jgi:hypothetical protein
VEDFPAETRPYHDQLRGRSMLVRKARPLPVECIVRGYLSGSGWKDYQKTGAICGIPLPEGLKESDRLPAPIFTPSTKAELGEHDENIGFDDMVARIGGELAERIRRALVAAGDDGAARALGESWISTIHAMCARILRQHAFAAGVDPYFVVLDQVEASALEASALEQAIEESLATDEGSVALLDTFGFDTVAGAVLRVSASVRALGLEAGSVRTVGPGEAIGQLGRAAVELQQIAEELGALRQCKTVDGNIAAVATAARLVAGMSAGGSPDEDALGCLGSPGLRRLASVEGLNVLVDAAAAQIERARQSAAQQLVAGHERAFLELTGLFERRYAHLKQVRGALDFSDLEVETLRLLESHPRIADRYRARFAMLMLDEFQDTNVIQARIIGLL